MLLIGDAHLQPGATASSTVHERITRVNVGVTGRSYHAEEHSECPKCHASHLRAELRQTRWRCL
jgi:hypothetical protein